MLEAHAPGGAVVYLDSDSLLVAPSSAVDAGAVRSMTCLPERGDRERVTEDHGKLSAASAASLDAVLSVLGCDVTGFRIPGRWRPRRCGHRRSVGRCREAAECCSR